MNKITSLVSALAISTAASLAVASGWEEDWAGDSFFVGLEGGIARTEVKVEGGNKTVLKEKKNKTKSFGVRVGSSWDGDARGYLTLGQTSLKDIKGNKPGDEGVKGMKQLNVLFSADWLFMPQWPVRPFAGLTLGATSAKASDFKKKWGVAYGAQAGGLFQAGNFDIEAGVKYLSNNREIHHSQNSGIKLKANSGRHAYLAATLHF